MTTLTAEQAQVVGAPPELPDGVAWPEVRYQLHDHGHITPEEKADLDRYGRQVLRDVDRSVPQPLAGHCEIWCWDGQWFARRETPGGSCRSTAKATREEAVADLERQLASTVAFWVEKVGWLRGGDRAPDRYYGRTISTPVIRCGGVHYTLGREPSEAELRQNVGLGFGGSQVAFRMLATGERVQSRNCWHQGAIPAEFRELLPDNAETADSDQALAMRESRRRWEEQQEARQLDRAWRDEALRAWRGPAEELRAHELLVAWDHALRQEYAMRVEEDAARQLARDWAEEAYRAWRGSWADLMAHEQMLWEEHQDYLDYVAEMHREHYGSWL